MSTEESNSNNNDSKSGTGYEAPSDIPTPTNEVETDDLGYEIVKEQPTDELPVPPAPSDEPTDSKEEVENPSTGYGEEPPAPAPEEKEEVEEKPEEASEDDADKETERQKAIKEAIDTVPEGMSKEKLQEFAIENGLSADQVKAYLNQVKADQADSIKARERFVAEQRVAWDKELREDPAFGGEHFARNIHHAEKALEKYLPNFKKSLDGSGKMLPPDIMRDLSALYKLHNPTTNLVNGDPTTNEDTSDNYLDALYS